MATTSADIKRKWDTKANLLASGIIAKQKGYANDQRFVQEIHRSEDGLTYYETTVDDGQCLLSSTSQEISGTLTLKIGAGTSGTPHVRGDNFVIQHAGDDYNGMSLICPEAGWSTVYLGKESDTDAGWLRYIAGATDQLSLGLGVEYLRLTGNLFVVTGSVSARFDNNATFTSAVNISGATNMASSLTIGGNISGTDGFYIGNTSVPQAIHFVSDELNFESGEVNITGEFGVTGNTQINGTFITQVSASSEGDARWTMDTIDLTSMGAGVGGGIAFHGAYTSAGITDRLAGIWLEKSNGTHNNDAGQLHFGTRVNGGNISDDMYIDSAGDVFANNYLYVTSGLDVGNENFVVDAIGDVTILGAIVTDLNISGAVSCTSINLGDDTISDYVKGSFTLSATGMTTTPTNTGFYTRIGNIVTLAITPITGISNSANFTFTGLPASIYPAGGVVTFVSVIDNGIRNYGRCNIDSSGSITFALASGVYGSGWSTSGTKGLETQFSVSYQLSPT